MIMMSTATSTKKTDIMMPIGFGLGQLGGIIFAIIGLLPLMIAFPPATAALMLMGSIVGCSLLGEYLGYRLLPAIVTGVKYLAKGVKSLAKPLWYVTANLMKSISNSWKKCEWLVVCGFELGGHIGFFLGAFLILPLLPFPPLAGVGVLVVAGLLAAGGISGAVTGALGGAILLPAIATGIDCLMKGVGFLAKKIGYVIKNIIDIIANRSRHRQKQSTEIQSSPSPINRVTDRNINYPLKKQNEHSQSNSRNISSSTQVPNEERKEHIDRTTFTRETSHYNNNLVFFVQGACKQVYEQNNELITKPPLTAHK